MMMIDVPSPFAPKSELEAFLKQYETGPGSETPDAREAVKEVRGYLALTPADYSSKATAEARAEFLKATRI